MGVEERAFCRTPGGGRTCTIAAAAAAAALARSGAQLGCSLTWTQLCCALTLAPTTHANTAPT